MSQGLWNHGAFSKDMMIITSVDSVSSYMNQEESAGSRLRNGNEEVLPSLESLSGSACSKGGAEAGRGPAKRMS